MGKNCVGEGKWECGNGLVRRWRSMKAFERWNCILDIQVGEAEASIASANAWAADFFDGKHNIVLGGSWATHPRLAGRRSLSVEQAMLVVVPHADMSLVLTGTRGIICTPGPALAWFATSQANK